MPGNDNVDLFDPIRYLRSLIQHWKLIAAGTLVAALAGVALALTIAPRFESQATIVLSPPPFKQAEALNLLMPSTLSVPDYEVLLASEGVMMRAAERALEIGDWSEEDAERLLEISRLKKQLRLEVTVSEKTATSVQYSPVIELYAEASTAENAQALAQAWAEVCEEVSREVYEQGRTGLKEFIGDRFADTTVELETAGTAIRDLEIEWNDELAHAKMAKVHSRLLDYQEKLIDTEVKIATVQEELAHAQGFLEEAPERITLWKSPPMEAAFLNEELAESAEEKGFREEQLNPVHLEMKNKVQLKEIELANLEEHSRQMEAAIGDLETELQLLREETATRAFERKMLNMAETPHLRSYDTLSTMLEQAKIVEAETVNLADLKIISQPVVPDRKSWPPRTLLVLVAGGAGFFLSSVGILGRDLAAAIR